MNIHVTYNNEDLARSIADEVVNENIANDQLVGNVANEDLVSNSSNYNINEHIANDQLVSTSSNDQLISNNSNDKLIGNSSNEHIINNQLITNPANTSDTTLFNQNTSPLYDNTKRPIWISKYRQEYNPTLTKWCMYQYEIDYLSILLPRRGLTINNVTVPTIFNYAYCLAFPSHADILAVAKSKHIMLLQFCNDYFEVPEKQVIKQLTDLIIELVTKDIKFYGALKRTGNKQIKQYIRQESYFCGIDNLYGRILMSVRKHYIHVHMNKYITRDDTTPDDIKNIVNLLYRK